MQEIENSRKLRRVKISEVIPSPHQTRVFPEGWEELESTKEMVQSIKDYGGVFQPPLVRLGVLGKYILIAGERRLRCSRLAGMKEINVIVADIPEKEAAKITASENYHREDLTIIEEAAAIKVLIEAYDGDVKEVAEYLDKSERWIRNWAKIADMEECWKEEMDEFPKWKAGHWRVIASLPAEAQRDVYHNHKERGWWLSNDMTVNNIKSVMANYFCELSEAIWPLHLFKGSCGGTCDSCVKRTDAQKNLFDDEIEKRENARCLDKECYERKEVEYIAEEYGKAKKKYGEELLLGSENWYPNKFDNQLKELCGVGVLQNHAYMEAEKKETGTRPIFMVNGDNLCKVAWCIYKEPEVPEPKIEETAEEKAERERIEKEKKYETGLVKQLCRYLSWKLKPNELMDEDEQLEIEVGGEVVMPPLDVQVRLIEVVDEFNREWHVSEMRAKLLKQLVENSDKAENERFFSDIIRQNLSDELAYCFYGSLKEIELYCKLFKLDYAALKAEAEKTLAEKKDED